jgi:HlyD family secretion protein
MRIVRTIIIVALLVGVAIVVLQGVVANGGVTAQASSRSSLVQDEALVELSDLEVTVNATGTIAPARQVTLSFELNTLPVKEVLVREGQPVEAGDVLARLDMADLELALRGAQLALEQQRIMYNALLDPAREVDIAVAQAAVDAAQAAVNAAFDSAPDSADREMARLQAELARNRLWQQQLQRDQIVNPEIPEGVPEQFIPKPSQEQIRQLEAGLAQVDYGVLIADANVAGVLSRGPDSGSLASANAQLVAAQIQLNRLLDGPEDLDVQRAELQMRQAELGVELAQANLDRGTLVAPFSGVIARSNLTVGELPSASGVIELIDDGEFYVDLAIDETEVADVQVGQPVTLQLDALPEAAVTGRISRVAQTPTRIGQVVTYIARVRLDPTLEPIRVGMNATARIKVQQLDDVLTLRNRFIRIDRATQAAYVTIQREDGRFEEVEVELGLRNQTHSQILSGLTAGQRVVLLPREELSIFGGAGS